MDEWDYNSIKYWSLESRNNGERKKEGRSEGGKEGGRERGRRVSHV